LVNLVTDALLFILDLSTTSGKLDHTLSEEERLELEKDKRQRKQIVQTKVAAVSKVSRLFSILREERETIVELKRALGKETLPPGTLALGLEEAKKSNGR
jgi:serine/threonine-protein phosphatase 2B catalytic subunit